MIIYLIPKYQKHKSNQSDNFGTSKPPHSPQHPPPTPLIHAIPEHLPAAPIDHAKLSAPSHRTPEVSI